MREVRTKRVYEPAEPDDGFRVLVDRVWPRGLTKEQVRADLWLKEVAPSTGLRQWFGHEARRWDEFCRRYMFELDANPDPVARLLEEGERGCLTLLYSARDDAHNQAVALAVYLRRRNRASRGERAGDGGRAGHGGRTRRAGAGERYVALLRGINVGRAKRIAMADLRALVERLGYGGVRTLLNSGNVVFTGEAGETRRAAERIAEGIAAELGITARVTVVTADELAEIVAGNPLVSRASDASRLLVAVPADAAGLARLAPLASQEWSPEALALGRRAAYLWCPGGILESRAAQAVERALKDGVTSRNWATILKLHALATGEA